MAGHGYLDSHVVESTCPDVLSCEHNRGHDVIQSGKTERYPMVNLLVPRKTAHERVRNERELRAPSDTALCSSF